jgi:hypothetical protein
MVFFDLRDFVHPDFDRPAFVDLDVLLSECNLNFLRHCLRMLHLMDHFLLAEFV